VDGLTTQLAQKATKTYVTYRDFGAVLDGVTSDKDAIKACHDYANQTGLPVVQHDGSAPADFYVHVKTDCDLSGFTLIVNDNSPNRNYNIDPDQSSSQTVNWDLTTLNLQLPSYAGQSFHITSTDATWRVGYRPNTPDNDLANFYHQEVAIDNDGYFLTHDFPVKFNGSFTLTNIQPLYCRGIVFKGLTIKDNNTSNGYKTSIFCTRNNTKICDITFISDNLSTSNIANNTDGGLVIREACFVSLDNILFENHSQVESRTGYDLSADYCYVLKWNNIKALGYAWGSTGTSFIEDWNVTNSMFSRLDNHYGIYGTCNFENITLINTATINLGYGTAVVNIDNIRVQQYHATTNDTTSMLVAFRPDFYCTFGGTLNINNDSLGGKLYLFYYTNSQDNRGNWSAFDTVFMVNAKNIKGRCYVGQFVYNPNKQPTIKIANTLDSIDLSQLFSQGYKNVSCILELYNCDILNFSGTGVLAFNCKIYSFYTADSTINSSFTMTGCAIYSTTINLSAESILMGCYISPTSITKTGYGRLQVLNCANNNAAIIHYGTFGNVTIGGSYNITSNT
jgi:hypothetical protein